MSHLQVGCGTSTHLILWVAWKELAVKMSGEHDSTGSCWILSGDDIRETFRPIRGRAIEGVFLNMPVELPECGRDVVLYDCIVVRIRRAWNEDL